MAVSAVIVTPFAGGVRAATWGGGSGFIAGISPGIVTVDGVAAAAWVYLMDLISKRIVAGVAAASDGTYRFDGVATTPRRWAVLAEDFSGEHNMVIRAYVTAVAA